MEISLKKLKGTPVFFENKPEPWGIVSDVVFDCKQKKAVALLVKTLSLVPICNTISLNSAKGLFDKKIILKSDVNIKNSLKNNLQGSTLNQIFDSDLKKGKLKDIHFDFETGALCDIIFSKNIIAGNQKISINKIFLKDNTIYIEN